jgi:hypothetical protein
MSPSAIVRLDDNAPTNKMFPLELASAIKA